MKKIISLALSVILVLSSLSFGVVTAFANTKQTAPKIILNETAEVYVDVNNKSYVEFTPATTGYYEFYCFTQSYGGNIMASIVDFDGETDNSVINDNYNPNLLCAAELMAGKTYYYKVIAVDKDGLESSPEAIQGMSFNNLDNKSLTKLS